MKMRQFEAHQPKKEEQSSLTPTKCYKNYLRAKKYAFENVKIANEGIELGYYQFISSLKKLYATLPNYEDKTIIERDRLKDFTSTISMHSFLAPDCYFLLECTYDDRFEVVYQLEKCLIEHEIRALMKDCFASHHLKEKKKRVPYKQYFQMALQVQPAQHIIIL
jgi:hypothetical protein